MVEEAKTKLMIRENERKLTEIVLRIEWMIRLQKELAIYTSVSYVTAITNLTAQHN
jgi:hypothetical protein